MVNMAGSLDAAIHRSRREYISMTDNKELLSEGATTHCRRAGDMWNTKQESLLVIPVW